METNEEFFKQSITFKKTTYLENCTAIEEPETPGKRYRQKEVDGSSRKRHSKAPSVLLSTERQLRDAIIVCI